MRWLRLHAMIAPFGVFAVTVFLLARSGKWSGWESLESAATLVDLGAVVYGMIAVLVERGVDMVFWALEQRQKRREKLQAEARAAGLAEGRAAGLAAGRVAGRVEGRAEGLAEERKRNEARMARISQRMGIPIEELLSQDDEAK